MNVPFTEARIVQFLSISGQLAKLLNVNDEWWILEHLFGIDEPSNDTYYKCHKPSVRLAEKLGCPPDVLVDVIIPAIWGPHDVVVIGVCW